jgi:FMN-dependent oxidoreductase (nitrilotriacetate monooxygenase family)
VYAVVRVGRHRTRIRMRPSSEPSRLVLGAFLYPTGYHAAAWRHPDVAPTGGIDVEQYVRWARVAEAGGFDFLFLPDSSSMRGDDLDVLGRSAIRYVAQLEPLTLLAALARETTDIGLAATVSSTYNEPYPVARAVASLDHVSRGRVAWNLVTSQNPYEAANHSRASLDHDARYARAEEFVDVVTALWDTWDDSALVADTASGVFFDAARVCPLDHAGEHFRVRGPLNVPRSPQGRPVTLQAGSSEPGRALAARTADVIFTAQDRLDDARAFRADIRARARRFGRDPDDIRVLVGLFPFTAPDDESARRRHDEMATLIDDEVAVSLLASELGMDDLDGHPLDGPLPPLPVSSAGRSRQDLLVANARRNGLSIRELAVRVAGSRGHLAVVAGGGHVADLMQEWFEAGAADGFIVMAPDLPVGLDAVVEYVVPVLARRGLLRPHQTGVTLRERLGLPRPYLDHRPLRSRT